MVSSDDEEERVPRAVTEYYFEDEGREPISFVELPLQWRDGESTGGKTKSIVLRAIVDNGKRNIYLPVTAWKFDLLDAKLKIFVLSKNSWVKLQSPKKSYAEKFIRTILITLHVLHYCRDHSRASIKTVSDHLYQVYRYGRRPSKDDLRDHMDLVGDAVKKDKVLAKSKFVIALLDEKNGKTKKTNASAEDAKTTKMSVVLCDDMVEEVEETSSDDDDEQDIGVCDICDDGGTILRCEGECLRAFHSGVENNCESLRFASDEVEAICNFFCDNCKYKQHQCFICGKLGSSDKDSAVAEVFRCVSGECGRFYHPLCVSKMLHRGSEDKAQLLKEKIANGASFTCPIHKCSVCNQGEIEGDDQMRFAVCRRCPKSYHRKCLPREISFESVNDEGITIRAWDTVLPKKRVLIYCLDHEIDALLGTPIRNHVKFPIMKNKKQASEVFLSGEKAESSTNLVTQKRSICLPARPDSSKKHKASHDNEKCHDVKYWTEEKNSLPTLGAESEKSILALIKDVSSSITIEDIYTKHKRLTRNANLSQDAVDKITLGKVQGSVEALYAALQKLDEGCSIDDAKAVCGPGLLHQLTQWKTKLRIYLEPFLLGVHYTSHGRYFTKSDKLHEIADILHSYIQEDDMIVDFGCGANEFSCLMKKKLDDVGKKCSYKNYDIIQPKNDFHFERRNWMSVHPSELLPGSQLIIGLNPPFGVDANRANQFINKALEFRPKLIVLIVPSETERLDRKNPPYDLLFEDNELLNGKAFYLPGSMDVDGKQMEQWNIPTPSLYFWSRPDWTAKHMAIAQQQGHLCKGAEVSDDKMKTSTPSQSTVSNHTADLCDDRMKTTPKQSTDICDDRVKSSTLKQSTESNHTDDLCDDGMKISTPSQSTESNHTKVVLLDLLGFAPGPYRPLQNNSAGWLDE
ncbi:putative histone-lysine N-methyltransferase chromatin regulator PHD family [Heracleum sosnowskyi]|uniref:Histone-lysine N-methyltransferase chromatin regulator PHD family n=1 Tax=Heracleum sosnowskyi TaxID=360622 RepID=A0AAD8JK86_9APIA|nr:putative histone-lysine N-methyltransferase chromatin regulator PHD family [Heracleum sosnowskyi]